MKRPAGLIRRCWWCMVPLTGWRAWVSLVPECQDCRTPFLHRHASRWAHDPVPCSAEDRAHCQWCSIELARWRVFTGRRYCSACGPRIHSDAGIYLQSGGPPCPYRSRAGQTEREVRTGTVSCECGWSRRQHWWLPGFTVSRIVDLHHQHRVEAHPETIH